MKLLCRAVAVLLVWLPSAAHAGDVLLNEIHYDPPDETLLEELVELYNAGAAAVDLSGWYFSDGIEYTIPDGTVLGPGEYLVIAESPDAIKTKFGASRILGPFEGHLSNEGERVLLRNASGAKEDEVDYRVGFPWPIAPGGRGSSMELIHPSLDNNLGGSWRPSGGSRSLPLERIPMIPPQDASWHYRKGVSEASDPPSAWRAVDFVEDASWLVGQTSIGFGDDDDKTVLDDMLNGYTTVYVRHAFTIEKPEAVPSWLKLRLYVDDGAIAWLNGVEVARTHVVPGEKAYNDVGRSNEARWEDFVLPGTRAILRPGVNVLAIHALNVALSSNDFSIDAELFVPSRGELPPAPTPGEENSVTSANAPPQVRQVETFPTEPRAGEAIEVTAKVTDPEGVAGVSLKYQIVLPGSFIPAELAHEPSQLMARPLEPRPKNPAFEDPAGWIIVPMSDDGVSPDAMGADGIYTGVIPPQINRTLVRYRITASDRASLEVMVPYADDESLNFACFVHDGVPPYTASKVSVHPDGPGHVYPSSVLESIPVYFLISRNADIARCVAYNSSWQIPKSLEAARDAFNWEGAFVYDGKVYDHVNYRLRQANDRYGGGGKRSWRFRFNKGSYLRARDQRGEEYPTRWRTLNTGKMFDNKGVGNFGLTETLNTFLWNLTGVPAPFMHTFHFRVIDAADEAPAGVNGQYYGDFWGMALAIEDYDPRFLDAHGLADGNLYKLKDGIFDGKQLKRNQGRHAVTTDADFQNIRTQLRPTKDAAWLDTHVNYARWYPYHAVVEAIRHYDFVPADSHSKNRAWFFEPAEGSPLGRLWTLPWDHDASWGPSWNSGIDYSKNAIFAPPGKPELKLEYRSVIREVRDLIWQEDVIHGMIDDLAAVVAELSKADRDRWRSAPADAGTQDFGTMENKVADMKRFAFVGWNGSTGEPVPAGGRAKHLDNLSNAEGDAASIPSTPAVTYAGPPGYPIDGLVFETTAFTDPQGDGTFGSMKWRIAEVTDPVAPAFDPARPRRFEYEAAWESEELTAFAGGITIPLSAAQPGHAYRVRVRMSDNTGHTSRWSAPVQFIAGDPQRPIPVEQFLRVTEVMYNPVDGGDVEFMELQNTGTVPLDLTGVRFTEGVDFAFEGSDVTAMGPGEHVVVVKNLGVFEARYDTGSIRIAGEYGGKLDNEGDEIALVYGSGLAIQRFTYDDSWIPETDGEGYSLVIADPGGALETWSKKDGWIRSRDVHGSPGRADNSAPLPSLQLPGDLTQDAQLNLSDAVSILGHLFLGRPSELPCAGGTFASPGNRALVDANGDALLNLTDGVYLLRYLFLSDPPPVLGTACIRIAGCPDVCAP